MPTANARSLSAAVVVAIGLAAAGSTAHAQDAEFQTT